MKWLFIFAIALLTMINQAKASIIINKDNVGYRILMIANDGEKTSLNVDAGSIYEICSECMIKIEDQTPLFVSNDQEVIIENGELLLNEGEPVFYRPDSENDDAIYSDEEPVIEEEEEGETPEPSEFE